MNKIKRVTTVLGGFLALFAFNPPADAAPSVGPVPSVKSICETGWRGMPDYDRFCLVRGDVLDGVNLWFRHIDTNKRVSVRDRREFCKYANESKTTRAGIIDGLSDISYDHYTNYRAMLSVAGTVGVLDCKALGIKIKK